MPINVPKLKSFSGQTGATKGVRINTQVRSNTDLIDNQTQGVSKLIGQADAVHDQYQDKQVDQVTAKLEQEYTPWLNGNLEEIKKNQGDPTEAYSNFDKAEDEKVKSLLSNHKDLSEAVRTRIERNLGGIQAKNRVKTLKQRGYQQEVYKNNLYESQLSLKGDALPTSAGYIKKGDQGSYVPFELGLSEIKTTIAKRAMESGTAERLPDDAKSGYNHFYQNDKGETVKVKLSPVAQVRAAKELSKGVANSVKVLLDTGSSEEAKEMMEKYKGYIEPVAAAKLTKQMNDVDIKDTAYSMMGGFQDLSENEQLNEIEKVKSVELKSELLKIKDSMDARRTSMDKRQKKQNYELLANTVIERMGSSTPYYGIADLEKDPMFKQTWDNLDSKGKQDIKEMIVAPKTTTSSAEVNMQNLLFGETDEEIETITPAEFQSKLSGMNDKDRRRYTGLYNNIRIETAGEKRATYKRAGSFLQDSMLSNELITKNKYDKFDEDDQIILIEARNKMMDHISKYGTNMDDKEVKDFVGNYVTSIVKERAFNPAPRRKDKIKATEDLQLSGPERLNFKKKFRDDQGYMPRNNDEKFKAYVRNQRK